VAERTERQKQCLNFLEKPDINFLLLEASFYCQLTNGTKTKVNKVHKQKEKTTLMKQCGMVPAESKSIYLQVIQTTKKSTSEVAASDTINNIQTINPKKL